MISDIALAIVIIFIPGMVHVMLPARMARMYEKSYRARLEAMGRTPGKTALRPAFIFIFGLIWIAFGVWIIADAVFFRGN
jgi:hypothetical protein